MAKLKVLRFELRGPAGDTMRFEVPVSVSSTGIFAAKLPAEIEAEAVGLIEASESRGERGQPVWGSGSGVYYERNKDRSINLCSQSLAEIEHLIAKAGEDSIRAEKEVSFIIQYEALANVACYRRADGGIQQNGQGDPDYRGTWVGQYRAHVGGAHYSVGLGARILKKTVFTSKSSTKTDRRPAGTGDPIGPYGQKLCAFVGLDRLDQNPRGCQSSTVREIPYTELAAKFFYEALMELCRIANTIDLFFSDETRVQQALTNPEHTILALGSSAGPDNPFLPDCVLATESPLDRVDPNVRLHLKIEEDPENDVNSENK